MEKNKLQIRNNSQSLSIRSNFENNYNNLRVHPLVTSSSGVFRYLNGNLYHKTNDDNWLIFSPNSEVPIPLILPPDYKTYMAKNNEFLFYKTEDNYLAKFDLFSEEEIQRKKIVSNLFQVAAGRYFYSKEENQKYRIYDDNLILLGEIKVPVYKKYWSFKGHSHSRNRLVFASFPERCNYTNVHIFNLLTRRWTEFKIDIWFGSSAGHIDDVTMTIVDLYEIFLFNLETGELQFWADLEKNIFKWRYVEKYFCFIDKTNSIKKLHYTSNNIYDAEFVTHVSPSLEFIPYGISNFYFKKIFIQGGFEIHYFNLVTHTWKRIHFKERLLQAQIQTGELLEYMVLTLEFSVRVLVIDPQTQKVIEKFEFPYCLDVTGCSLHSTRINIHTSNRPGYTIIDRKFAKAVVNNTLNPGYVVNQKSLPPDKLIVLTNKEITIFLDDLTLGVPVKLPKRITENKIEISPNVLSISADNWICLIAEVETKLIKTSRNFLDIYLYQITYHLIDTRPGKEKVTFSWRSGFSKTNSAKGVILYNNAAYVCADGFLNRIDLISCEIRTVYKMASPNTIFTNNNKYVICGVFNPESDLPHFLVFNDNGNKSKLNLKESIYVSFAEGNDFFYYYFYSSSKEKSFFGKMKINDDKEFLTLEKIYDRSGSDTIFNVTGEILWLRDGCCPSLIKFYHTAKDIELGFLYVFSDGAVVITCNNSKYFYASDLSKLVFINKKNTQIQPDRLYLSVYNNWQKTMQAVGLDQKKVDIFRELQKLTNPPENSQLKQLPSNF